MYFVFVNWDYSLFDEAKVWQLFWVIRLINICIRIKIFTSVCCRL